MIETLPVNDLTRQAIRRVRAHAERPEHWHEAGVGLPPDPTAFIARIGSYICIYSWRVADQKVQRYLSVCTRSPGDGPHAVIAFTLATMFGFTGGSGDEDVTTIPGEDWIISGDQSENGYGVAIIEQWISKVEIEAARAGARLS